MKSVYKKVTATVVALLCLSVVVGNAQNEAKGIKFNVSGDLVSAYIWRGMYQTSASIQPTLGLSVAGFSLTAWGSTDFTGVNENAGLGAKEIDFTAAYTVGNTGLTIAVADLWWGGQGTYNYFNMKSHETAHHIEGTVSYVLPCQQFPLSIAWNTMFAGMDKNSQGKQAYSTYVEMNYPFSVKGVDLNATCGLTPWNAAQYNTNSFAVTNVALKGTKAIKFSNSFSMPLFAQVIWSPRMEDVHLVLGITLRP